MLQQLLSIIAFCSIALAAFGAGRPLVRGLGIEQRDRLSTAVWSIALGVIAAGLLLAVMGLLGVLYVPLIVALTLAGCAWGFWEMLRSQFKCETNEPEFAAEATQPADYDALPSPGWEPPRLLFWCLGLAVLAACAGSLVGALAPPTAGDALCYHLELPKAFLLEHELVYLPYSDNSTFPLLAEMWYLWGLALDGGVCAQLVHWGLGLLLGAAAAVLAGPIIGRRWALVAGALVLLTPGINNQMTAPLNDIALAVMTTLALAAWFRAVVDDMSRRWFLAAGLAGGAALSTKYIAGVFAAAVAITWIWALIRRPGQRRMLLQGVAVVVVLAVSVGGIWYVRAAWHRGNPVYPFLGEVFASRASHADTPRETLPASKSPLGRSLHGLAAAPWQITMHPERFGGRGHQLGLLPLAVLPGLFFVRRLRGLGTLLAVAAAYFVIWYMLRQNVRFLFPIVPLLAVAMVWVWMEMGRLGNKPRVISTAAIAATLAVFAIVPLARSKDKICVATGVEDRENYLLRSEPAYRAAAVANAMMKPGDRLLTQDYRAFYFNSRVTRESIYRREEHYDRQIAAGAELSDRLRAAGFDYLLLAETLPADDRQYDPTLSRLVDAQLRGPAADKLVCLTDYSTIDPAGVTRHYRLIMLR